MFALVKIWQEKKVIEKLKRAKAFSPESAVEPEQADIKSRAERSTLHHLMRRGKVHEASYKHYYVPREDGEHC